MDEMINYSIINKSELEGTQRIDSEYYKPEYLGYCKLLSKYRPLSEYIIRILHPVEIKREYEDNGLQILLAQNIRDNFLDFSEKVFMPEHVINQIAKNRLKRNDVVMTRSGVNYGDSAYYDGEPEVIYACADCLVIRPNGISGAYLSTFLNTHIGKSLVKRGAYGTAQPHISPAYLRELRIPMVSDKFQNEVENILDQSKFKFRESESIYLQAERMLIDEIGLSNFDFSQKNCYSVPLGQTQELHRVDAEYFQPKFVKLVKHLNKVGKMKPLVKVASYIKRGLQPTYVDDGNIVVVNSKHLGRYILNIEDTERTDYHFWETNKRARLEQNDVLVYSTGAYVGRTNVWLENHNGIASNHVTIIRNLEGCDPIYLAVYLNSLPGLLQAEKWATGSGQRELYPEPISNFYIYLPSQNFQSKIANLVIKSYETRKKAKLLIEEAKKKVEEVIEKETIHK